MPYSDPIKEKENSRKRQRKYHNKPLSEHKGNKLIFCSCGCRKQLWFLDNHNRKRYFISGHNGRNKKQSKEWIDKKIQKIKGENCHFWKGGVTPIHLIIRESLEYDLWRKKVFKRDNYTCQICGAKGNIEAHHIKRFSLFPELRFDLNNGQTLCRDCHKLKTLTELRGGDVFAYHEYSSQRI